MAENAKDSDERDLRGGRGCAPVRLVDQERRAELDRQGHGLGFTGVQFLGILGYAIGVQGSPNLEERQAETSMLSNGLRGSANWKTVSWKTVSDWTGRTHFERRIQTEPRNNRPVQAITFS